MIDTVNAPEIDYFDDFENNYKNVNRQPSRGKDRIVGGNSVGVRSTEKSDSRGRPYFTTQFILGHALMDTLGVKAVSRVSIWQKHDDPRVCMFNFNPHRSVKGALIKETLYANLQVSNGSMLDGKLYLTLCEVVQINVEKKLLAIRLPEEAVLNTKKISE